MDEVQRALALFRAQEQERELARAIRRETTWGVLHGGSFARMRAVIPQWWEWVATGHVRPNAEMEALIERRFAEVTGLREAIIEDWG
jgi:hypothetical protein